METQHNKAVEPTAEAQTPSANEAGPGSSFPQTKPNQSTNPEPAPRGRSTGPRTQAGKRKSRKNAKRHGIFEKAIFVDGEPSPQFNSLVRRLKADGQALKELEQMLWEKVATILWRQARFIREETEFLNAMEFAEVVRSEGSNAERAHLPEIERLQEEFGGTESPQTLSKRQALILQLPQILERFAAYERHLGRELDRALSQIERIRRILFEDSHLSTSSSPKDRGGPKQREPLAGKKRLIL